MRTIGQASVLSEPDWKKLESVANQKHRLLWSILRFTAARINEALELRIKDVYKDAIRKIPLDEVVFRQETRKGKDKNHTVPICSELRTRLKDYVPSTNPEDYLFPGIDGRLSYEAALVYLKKSAEKVGLDDKRIVTHCGRRSCITELARRGTDLRTIQAVSGHTSIANLQRYIETDPDRTKNALEGIFP
ncbi:MAG: site-specific integrase [Microcystis wesenbergii TW10]|uniref:Site-specific integrase n=1 Tax=Microcystis wesenbergii TW10 TaxID=2060474 RepID=A0A3E0LT02_9CHRO|nr:MAG: site-specific integrase [Microcystis wesenbergii TW10]